MERKIEFTQIESVLNGSFGDGIKSDKRALIDVVVIGLSMWLGAKIVDTLFKSEADKIASVIVSNCEIVNN